MIEIPFVQNHCLQLKGTTVDLKWGADLVYSVGGKMYLVLGEGRAGMSVSLKVPQELFTYWTQQPGVIPAPYLARVFWIQFGISTLDEVTLAQLIEGSYELVLQKLTKKLRLQILAEVSTEPEGPVETS